MKSRELVVFDDIPLTDIPREMLLELADEFGIRKDVAKVLREKEAAGKFGLRLLPLPKLLKMARVGQRRGSRNAFFTQRMVTEVESGNTKNMSMKFALKISRAYKIPFWVIICAALRYYGYLPAPGAKVIPRNRTRVQEPD